VNGHRIPGLPAAAALFVLSMAASCTSAVEPVPCRRVDVASMGPENAFRVTIAPDTVPALDGSGAAIHASLTLIPPVVGPVTLLQFSDGREVARWELKLPAATSTTCRIAATAAASTCGATIVDAPHLAGGHWSIEAGGNRILEAGLAFELCD
jgi:hypothetical protein